MADPKQFLYRMIFEDIQKRIDNGEYPTGSFLPPERTMCRNYNVERPTLRRALQLLVENGCLKKVQGSGNEVIAHGKGGDAPTIVYMIPHNDAEFNIQPYHMEIYHQLEAQCATRNFNTVFARARFSRAELAQWLGNNHVVGIFWVSNVNRELIDEACARGIHSIVICGDYGDCPRINLDDTGGALAAVNHLIARGCRKIAHISGPACYFNSLRRLDGYRLALGSAGLPFDETLVRHGDWSYAEGFARTQELLREHPDIDGIFAANDMMALGALNASMQLGCRVPAQLRIIGMDDIEQAAMAGVPLTTISFGQKEIARCAILLLREYLAGGDVPGEVLLPARLMVRQTT